MFVIRRLFPALIACALLMAVALPAAADEGLLRLSWDGCDPIIQNKDFLGSGSRQVAILVLSVSGFGLSNNGVAALARVRRSAFWRTQLRQKAGLLTGPRSTGPR